MSFRRKREDPSQTMDTGGDTDEEAEPEVVVEKKSRKPLPPQPKEKEEEENDQEDEYSVTYEESPLEKGVRKSHLQKLFDQEVDDEGLEVIGANSDEAKNVDKAFRNLESRLGNAGKRCIEAYHKWGRNFWGQPEKEVLLGLLNGYWHQIMISTGVRLNADRKEASKTKQVVLLPPLTSAMANWKGNPPDSFPVPTGVILDNFKSERSGNPLNIETGHFKSINHRIRRDAKIQCAEGNTITGPCVVQPTEQYVAWAKIVNKVTEAWMSETRKHTRAPKQILQLFQHFLLEPTLVRWNNLIGASVLWKTHDKFLNAHGDWLSENGSWDSEYAALGNFFNREIPTIYNVFQNNDRLMDDYPPGYVGLMREMLINEKNDAIWNAINAVEARFEKLGKTLSASELDDAAGFYASVKNVSLQNVPAVEKEVQPDGLIRKRQSQAAKKAKKGQMEARISPDQVEELQNLSTSGMIAQAKELDVIQKGISKFANSVINNDAPLDEAATAILETIRESTLRNIATVYLTSFGISQNIEDDPGIENAFKDSLRAFLPTAARGGASVMRYPNTSESAEGCNIM
jgi:hypothetical protein